MPYKGTKLALPASVVGRVRTIATEDGRNLDAQKMFQIRKPIEDWYLPSAAPRSLSHACEDVQVVCI